MPQNNNSNPQQFKMKLLTIIGARPQFI